MNPSAIRVPGFAAPARDSQRVFRAVLEAMARPTLPQTLAPGVTPPEPLGAVAAAVLLALCDAQTPLWVDDALRGDAAAWLRFHTDAPLAEDPADAVFAVASAPEAAPRLDELAEGTDEEPHRSATLVIDASGSAAPGATEALVASGPGVQGDVAWDGHGLPELRGEHGFLAQWRANHRAFPRGVDVVLAGTGWVRALPRTTALDTTVPGRTTDEEAR